jgi:antitoxin (DNA-binding transcriptional repressor) of toxin-antitoxin stability system
MRVSIQEFKSHLSQYVSQAQVGQLIELTSHRRVVARLIGVPPADASGPSKLLAAGVASWQGGKPIGAAITLRAGSKPVSALVLEDRG